MRRDDLLKRCLTDAFVVLVYRCDHPNWGDAVAVAGRTPHASPFMFVTSADGATTESRPVEDVLGTSIREHSFVMSVDWYAESEMDGYVVVECSANDGVCVERYTFGALDRLRDTFLNQVEHRLGEVDYMSTAVLLGLDPEGESQTDDWRSAFANRRIDIQGTTVLFATTGVFQGLMEPGLLQSP